MAYPRRLAHVPRALSESLDTPTCLSKKLASTPPELASRRCPRSRGAVPSIGGSRQGRASCGPLGCRPRRRRAHARPSWKVAAGTSAIFLESGSAAQRLGASTRARAHIPGTGHNSRGGRPRPAHDEEPPGPLHLHGHFGKLPRARISLLSTLLIVASP